MGSRSWLKADIWRGPKAKSNGRFNQMLKAETLKLTLEGRR